MTNYGALIAGLLVLFLAAATALLFRFVPPAFPLYWALPALLLAVGCWLLKRKSGWTTIAIALPAALAGALLVLDLFWPGILPHGRTGPPPSLVAAPAPGPPGEEASPGGAALVAAELAVPPQFRRGPFSRPRTLELPPGFRISVFAAGLGGVRFLAVGPRGHLYASVPGEGKILVLPDADQDGVAEAVKVFAEGLERPHGLAFAGGGDLYAAGSGRLLRLRDADGDLRAEEVTTLSRDVPGGGGHWTRSVAVGPDGRLYVAAGSSCNVCIETDWRRAAVVTFARSGGPATLFASGLRNSVGLAFHPQTGELWAGDNGRDLLGDELPPEELNRIVRGGDYGWPFCYGRGIPDPEFGSAERCADSLAPVVAMQAHSAPLGLAFGFDLRFPPPYRRMLYVAFHGSWNRTEPTGYKLVAIPFRDGQPAGPPVDMVRGWLQGMTAWGRPVAPVVGRDRALYLSDDRAGAIYRLTAEGGGGGEKLSQWQRTARTQGRGALPAPGAIRSFAGVAPPPRPPAGSPR